jgi:hypothetical protein
MATLEARFQKRATQRTAHAARIFAFGNRTMDRLAAPDDAILSLPITAAPPSAD